MNKNYELAFPQILHFSNWQYLFLDLFKNEIDNSILNSQVIPIYVSKDY